MENLFTHIRAWSAERQLLGRKGHDPLETLKAVIGVYSSHPSGPLSLWARLRSFDPEAFIRLDQEQQALRLPAMRLSVHMLPRETAFRVFSAMVPPASDPTWENRYTQKGRHIPPETYPEWQEQLLALATEPMSSRALQDQTDIPAEKLKFVLNRMAYEGRMLRVGASSLRSNLISYVGAEAWAGEDARPEDPSLALAWLAGEYLRAFGPARIKDFQWWAGVTAGKAKAALAAHETVEVDLGYLLLAEDLPAFEAFKPSGEDQIDLLPQWDCYTMGYAPDGRSRFVSQDRQSQLYGDLGATGGNALGAVMLNGFVHGVWTSRFKGNLMEVSLEMFEKPSRRVEEALSRQFMEMALFLDARKVRIETS